MKGVMDDILEELEIRNVIGARTYAVPYICSYAIHAFNQMNLDRNIYWESSRIPNMRLHILFIAPPGCMKTFYLRQMLLDDYAIFADCNVPINQVQNVSEAGLCGTFVSDGKSIKKRVGELQKHSTSIIGIDEFSALSDAGKMAYNNQFETQMLAALDHGDVLKTMAGGDIEFTTHFTLWGGVQPARYDLARGMGRRICFLLNIPDKGQKEEMQIAMRDSYNKRPNITRIADLHDKINEWIESFNIIDHVEYDDKIFDWYRDNNVETYDYTTYNKIILGYHLAKNGASSILKLDITDDVLIILKKLKEWRQQIILGADIKQVELLITENGVKLDDNMGYVIERKKFNNLGYTIQLSTAQLNTKLKEMKENGMVSFDSKKIELY